MLSVCCGVGGGCVIIPLSVVPMGTIRFRAFCDDDDDDELAVHGSLGNH